VSTSITFIACIQISNARVLTTDDSVRSRLRHTTTSEPGVRVSHDQRDSQQELPRVPERPLLRWNLPECCHGHQRFPGHSH